MCGIFGILLRPNARMSLKTTTDTLARLYKLSESRGKESAGLFVYAPCMGEAWTIKAAIRATDLLQSEEYSKLVNTKLPLAFDKNNEVSTEPLALLAHSRLVTNGAAALNQNNQPVRSSGATVIHNGIIVNVDELWEKRPNLTRYAEVDTEVVAAYLADDVVSGKSMSKATVNLYAHIKGAASIAWSHQSTNSIVLATNTGDLYFSVNDAVGYVIFASEKYILDETTNSLKKGNESVTPQTTWLSADQAVSVSLEDLNLRPFALNERTNDTLSTAPVEQRHINQHDLAIKAPALPVRAPTSTADETLLRYGEKRVAGLLRCTACVLPETFPYIAFDHEGVCNYCRSYKPRYKAMDRVQSKRDFIRSLEKYRRAGSEPDTIVAFSGGRDSSYGLHLIKNEFGLKPTTFTYDWGMVTDLARRNVARICGQLGIQNILVSADIRAKRDNIRKNVSAWLKKPDLGIVPLFMAGDKHFFRVVNQLKRQTGIALDLWSANPLENTDFKSGFCGVSPDFDKSRVDYLSYSRQMKMATYYGTRFLQNPRYLNSSLIDTAGAYFAYYVEPRRDFFFIFDHFPWEENEVNRVLLSEYDWELAPDTKSTWRIGDGTAPFYNYIYMTARGFSEFDTFRSNQIREGMISRDQALASIIVENRPRPQSIRWYLDTIGLDFNSTIQRINELDVMHLHR